MRKKELIGNLRISDVQVSRTDGDEEFSLSVSDPQPLVSGGGGIHLRALNDAVNSSRALSS